MAGEGPAWRELLVVAAVFIVATLLLTLPLAVHPTRTLPSDLVDTLLNSWIVGWDADRLRHGLRGVWDAPIYYPYRDTLAFSENLFGLAFFVAPVFWATGNAVLTYNAGFLMSFVIAGVGMYPLVKTLTGSRTAAAAAGCAYAFCPFRMAQIAHVQMVATGWIPIALWGVHQYFFTRARRWLIVFVGGWTLQALSNTYVAYYIAVPIVIVSIDGLVHASGWRRRAAIELAAAGVAVAALLAPVGAAYYRVRNQYQQVRSSGEISSGGADVRAYFVTKNSVGIWRWLPTAVTSNPEKELFPGIFAVLLAALAVWQNHIRKWRDRWIELYGSIAIAGFVLSLGPYVRIWGEVVTRHGPYDWLLHLVPGMNGMRVPARFAIIFFFGLSMLAGCGAAVVVSQLKPRLRPVALAVVFIAIVAEGWAVPLPVERYNRLGRPEDRAVAEWLHDSAPGSVLHLPVRTNNFQELNYQYATLLHGHPLVNGFSGYNTPLQEFFRNPSSPLYDWDRFASTVRMLRALGVRYVIVHSGDYNVTQLADGEPTHTVEGLRRSGQVAREARLLDVSAFELDPWNGDTGTNESVSLLSRGDAELSASESRDRLMYLDDGNRDTRWIGRQEGSSWIAARFRHQQDIARIELQLASRSLEDYPRELQIDVTNAQGEHLSVYRATPYPEFILGLVRDPQYPVMVIHLPKNESMSVAIRATAIYPARWWSVHELRFWTRN